MHCCARNIERLTRIPKRSQADAGSDYTSSCISIPAQAGYGSFANGVDRSNMPFRGFLPRKTTLRDLYQATVFAKLL